MSNEILDFAQGAGATVLTQAEYAALTTVLGNGFQSGILPANYLNKVLRQHSLVCVALAKLVDSAGINVVDDGDSTGFKNDILTAITSLVAPDASTTVKGKIEIATDAEAQALSSALLAITPASLKGAFKGSNQSLSGNGYQVFPGGMILQWGFQSVNYTTSWQTANITFPIAFPTACHFAGSPELRNGSTGFDAFHMIGPSLPSQTTLQASYRASATVNAGFYWFAIGN